MFNKFKSITYLTVLALLFACAFPANSFAGWDDRSDELPGYSNGEMLMFAAGTVLLVSLIVIASKSAKKDNAGDEMKPDDNPAASDSTSSSALFRPNEFSLASSETLTPSKQEFRVMPFVGLQKAPSFAGFSSNKLDRVVVGVSVWF